MEALKYTYKGIHIHPEYGLGLVVDQEANPSYFEVSAYPVRPEMHVKVTAAAGDQMAAPWHDFNLLGATNFQVTHVDDTDMDYQVIYIDWPWMNPSHASFTWEQIDQYYIFNGYGQFWIQENPFTTSGENTPTGEEVLPGSTPSGKRKSTRKYNAEGIGLILDNTMEIAGLFMVVFVGIFIYMKSGGAALTKRTLKMASVTSFAGIMAVLAYRFGRPFYYVVPDELQVRMVDMPKWYPPTTQAHWDSVAQGVKTHMDDGDDYVWDKYAHAVLIWLKGADLPPEDHIIGYFADEIWQFIDISNKPALEDIQVGQFNRA